MLAEADVTRVGGPTRRCTTIALGSASTQAPRCILGDGWDVALAAVLLLLSALVLAPLPRPPPPLPAASHPAAAATTPPPYPPPPPPPPPAPPTYLRQSGLLMVMKDPNALAAKARKGFFGKLKYNGVTMDVKARPRGPASG